MNGTGRTIEAAAFLLAAGLPAPQAAPAAEAGARVTCNGKASDVRSSNPSAGAETTVRSTSASETIVGTAGSDTI